MSTAAFTPLRAEVKAAERMAHVVRPMHSAPRAVVMQLLFANQWRDFADMWMATSGEYLHSAQARVPWLQNMSNAMVFWAWVYREYRAEFNRALARLSEPGAGAGKAAARKAVKSSTAMVVRKKED